MITIFESDGIVTAVTRLDSCRDYGLDLSDARVDDIRSIANLKRRLERTAIYRAIDRLVDRQPLLRHNPDGSPFLTSPEGSPLATFISVSHSATHAAVALSDRPIGIDIENPSPKIDRVTSRFLSEKEMGFLSTPTSRLVAWTIKEAVYKAARIEGLPLVGGIEITAGGFDIACATVDNPIISTCRVNVRQKMLFAARSVIVDEAGGVLTVAYSLTP